MTPDTTHLRVPRPLTRREGARILVTGSQGFVGTHLRAALSLRGIECVGVDRPGSGAEIQVNLSDPALDFGALVEEAGELDSIIYMAATITRGSSVDALARDNLRAIAEGPVKLMEAFSAKGDAPHLIACSTFKMYGPSVVEREIDGAFDPADPPQRPDPHSYGSVKFLAERLLQISSRRAGYAYGVVRPSCIYGPGQHAKNAIPRFLAALLEGKAPTVYGAGKSIRDDVFAPDLSWMMIEAALHRSTLAHHGAGERSRSILEVAQLACDVAREEGVADLEAMTDPSKTPKWWIDQDFDLGSVRSELGYRPTPLKEGIRAQLRWMQTGGHTAPFGLALPEPVAEESAPGAGA